MTKSAIDTLGGEWHKCPCPGVRSGLPNACVAVEDCKDEIAAVELHLVRGHVARAALLGRVLVEQLDHGAFEPLVRPDAALDARADLQYMRVIHAGVQVQEQEQVQVQAFQAAILS